MKTRMLTPNPPKRDRDSETANLIYPTVMDAVVAIQALSRISSTPVEEVIDIIKEVLVKPRF